MTKEGEATEKGNRQYKKRATKNTWYVKSIEHNTNSILSMEYTLCIHAYNQRKRANIL